MNLPVLLATLQCLYLCIVHCYQQFQHQQPFIAPYDKADSADNLNGVQTFKLKSVYHHASVSGPIPGLFRRLDVPPMHASSEQDTFQIRSKLGTLQTAHDPRRMYELYKYDGAQGERLSVSSAVAKNTAFFNIQWKQDLMPDISHRPSVLALAKMTNNAYYEKCNETGWYDLGTPWNLNNSFGWEEDGIRGHIFGNQDNSLLVISFKGTSAGLWSGGPTGDKDKINDNLLFSCCCARISRAWTPVCDCYHGNDYLCESSCLEQAIAKKEFYYDHAMEIYKEVSDRYPNATIWLTGHSLGGVLASLVGQTFLVPTVTFETPPDRLASRRLHLPHPPGVEMPLWHFGHTADPIFIGACVGPSSSCWYGGFAMESKCHTGKLCTWDTVNDKGWRVDIRSHRIQDVIEYILKEEHAQEFPLPDCRPESNACDECVLWEFVDKRDDPPPSSSSSSTPSSRGMSSTTTSTCIPEPPSDPWDMYIPHNT